MGKNTRRMVFIHLKWRLLLFMLLITGCTQTVKFKNDLHGSNVKLAVLEFPITTKIKIDQKEVHTNWNGFANKMRIKLAPDKYYVEWIDGCIDTTGVWEGEGILNVQPGEKYLLKNCYLAGQTRLTGNSFTEKYFSTEILNIASWIENVDTQEVAVGNKPPWVNNSTGSSIGDFMNVYYR